MGGFRLGGYGVGPVCWAGWWQVCRERACTRAVLDSFVAAAEGSAAVCRACTSGLQHSWQAGYVKYSTLMRAELMAGCLAVAWPAVECVGGGIVAVDCWAALLVCSIFMQPGLIM
jgi:hypothetical protein